MKSTISGLIGLVLGGLVLFLLLRTVRKDARLSKPKNVWIVDYGWPVRLLGITALLMGIGFVFLAIISRGSSLYLKILFGVGSGAVCLYLFLETTLTRIEFDSAFIYTMSPWRGKRQIPWKDIVSCTYSDIHMSYKITTNQHGSLSVSRFRSGIGTFLEELCKIVKIDGF